MRSVAGFFVKLAGMDSKQHWDGVYAEKAEDVLSWHQAHPETSLALIHAVGRDKTDALIDVGGASWMACWRRISGT